MTIDFLSSTTFTLLSDDVLGAWVFSGVSSTWALKNKQTNKQEFRQTVLEIIKKLQKTFVTVFNAETLVDESLVRELGHHGREIVDAAVD